jgi:cation diffusion facilitator family transporter
METMRYKQIQRVHLIIIILNVFTAISKLFIGVFINSVSVTADGLHSMTDGLNNVVGMVGAYFAFQPIDEKHPYGHRKFETLTTLFISALLIITSISLLKGVYTRIINPVVPAVTSSSFVVMLLSIIVNICVTTFEKKMGIALQSDFLISDATHTLSDVFVSISVMGTLLAIKLGYYWIDILVSVFIALLIAKAAIDILKNGADILCDAMVLDPKDISNIVYEFDQVYSCHKIRSRGCADDIHLDLHVVVSDDFTLEKAHSLVHNIDDLLKSRLPGVTDVNVHVDPLHYYINKIEQTAKIN